MKRLQKQLLAMAICCFAPFYAFGEEATTPYVLVVYCSGGWDTTMVFDNKVGYSTVSQESPSSSAVTSSTGITYVQNTNRAAVTTFFDSYGGGAVIVNGINAGSMSQKYAVQNMFGLTPTKQSRPVDWAAYYAVSLASTLSMPHVVIGAPYMSGEYSAISTKLDYASLVEYMNPPVATTSNTPLMSFISNSYAGLFTNRNSNSLDFKKLETIYYAQGMENTTTNRLYAASLVLGQPDPNDYFEYYGKLAIELFAEGTTKSATVQAGATNAWDTTDSTDHFGDQSTDFNDLFADLSAILTYAGTKGVADNLLLVVVSDGGRAPKTNSGGGKDRWPVTSALLWGYGLEGGTVVNATSSYLRATAIDPIFGTAGGATSVALEMGNIISAIYLQNGIAYKLYSPTHAPLTTILSY